MRIEKKVNKDIVQTITLTLDSHKYPAAQIPNTDSTFGVVSAFKPLLTRCYGYEKK